MIEPIFSAVMCDGMGWFSAEDYKRMLMLFDKVYYLLPKQLVEFDDVGGRKSIMTFPAKHSNSRLFEACAFEPDATEHRLLLDAAAADAVDAKFAQAVNEIPSADRLYTWRMVNSDGDIGAGQSPGLPQESDVLAHALLLNKFVLTADRLGSVPISGQPHVHRMLRQKYDRGVPYFPTPDAAPVPVEIAQRGQPVALELSRAIVSDHDLSQRTEEQIVAFKEKHRDAFARFHVALRAIAQSIGAEPGTREFDARVRDIVTLSVWKDAEETRGELRSAWASFFRRAVTDVAGAALTVAVAPGAALIDLVAKGAPELAGSLLDVKRKRGRRSDNGLYYLLRFQEQPLMKVRE